MLRIFCAWSLALLAASAAAASEPAPSCRGSWNVVGACFAMHGTLSLVSRSPLRRRLPRARIAETGTGRIVGVLGITLSAEGPGVIPAEVARLMQPEPFDTVIEGDYVVCPLDREDHRRMQMVCIQDASNLHARPR